MVSYIKNGYTIYNLLASHREYIDVISIFLCVVMIEV
jgi:hypothetical protein